MCNFEGISEEWRTCLGTGTPRQPVRLCWTVNLSPNYIVKWLDSDPERWGDMRPAEQVKWLRNVYLHLVVQPLCDAYKFTFELTKSGEIHAHGLVIIFDNTKLSEYYLTNCRKSLTARRIRVLNRRGKLLKESDLRTMNHICINHPEKHHTWEEYLDKDRDKIPHRPSYYIHNKAYKDWTK